MCEFIVSKRELCSFFIDNDTTSENILKYLEENYNLTSSKRQVVLENIQQNLLQKFRDRWSKASRIRSRFLEQNASWLDSEFKVLFNDEETCPGTSTGRGRPSKAYEDLSDKTKKRKNMELVQEYGLEFVHNAYVQGLRSQKESEEASLVAMLRSLSRDENKTIRRQILHETSTVSTYSIHEALSLYIDLNLTKSQYAYFKSCTC